MSDLNKKEFIQSLSDDLKPVKVLRPPHTRYLIWLSVVVFTVITVMAVIQSFRPSLMHELSHFHFALETFLAFTPLLVCGYWAFYRSVPGNRQNNLGLYFGLICFSAFIGSVVAGLFGHTSLPEPVVIKRPTCLTEILVLSWIPIAFLAWMLRKGSVLYNYGLGAAIGLAGASLPMALMHLACVIDPIHTLVFHVGPMLGIAIVFTFISRWVFQKK